MYGIFSFVFKGLWFFFLQLDVFLSLKIVFILANKANPDELPAFYLGLELFANSIPVYWYENKKGYYNKYLCRNMKESV